MSAVESVPPCPKFMPLKETHDLCIIYLGQELGCSVLKGTER